VSLILSIIVIAYVANALIEGGIPSINWFNDIVVVKAFPMASASAAIFMFIVMYRNFQRKTMPLARLIPFFLAFFSILILGFGLGQENEYYQMQVTYMNIVPTAVAYIMIQFGLTSQAIARLKPRSGPYAFMIITMILVFMYSSPLGEVLDPTGTLSSIGKWLADNPAAAGYRAMWLGCYLGLTGVIVRIFFGREAMRVR
jgi:hypothetical protein